MEFKLTPGFHRVFFLQNHQAGNKMNWKSQQILTVFLFLIHFINCLMICKKQHETQGLHLNCMEYIYIYI